MMNNVCPDHALANVPRTRSNFLTPLLPCLSRLLVLARWSQHPCWCQVSFNWKTVYHTSQNKAGLEHVVWLLSVREKVTKVTKDTTNRKKVTRSLGSSYLGARATVMSRKLGKFSLTEPEPTNSKHCPFLCLNGPFNNPDHLQAASPEAQIWEIGEITPR